MKVCTIARASDTGVLRAQQKMHNTTVVERDLNDYASNDEDNDIRWRFWWWWYTLALSTMDENSISLWEFIQRLPHRRPQHLVHHQHRHHSGGDHGVCQTPSTPFHCDHLRSFSGHQAITRWSIVDYIATTRWSCSLSLWKYDWLRLVEIGNMIGWDWNSCCWLPPLDQAAAVDRLWVAGKSLSPSNITLHMIETLWYIQAVREDLENPNVGDKLLTFSKTKNAR